jgi:hypothetical protein
MIRCDRFAVVHSAVNLGRSSWLKCFVLCTTDDHSLRYYSLEF